MGCAAAAAAAWRLQEAVCGVGACWQGQGPGAGAGLGGRPGGRGWGMWDVGQGSLVGAAVVAWDLAVACAYRPILSGGFNRDRVCRWVLRTERMHSECERDQPICNPLSPPIEEAGGGGKNDSECAGRPNVVLPTFQCRHPLARVVVVVRTAVVGERPLFGVIRSCVPAYRMSPF